MNNQDDLFSSSPKPQAVEEPKGRAKGGIARAGKLSAERKAEIAKGAALARWRAPEPDAEVTPDRSLSVLEYAPDDGSEPLALGFDEAVQGVWATQQQIASLFGVDRTAVGRHLRNIFNEGELDQKSVCANFARTAADGKSYLTQHYNLDAVLSVGYRVNSKIATRFRQWATQTLRTYVEQGYVLNDKVLREHPEKLNKLAAEVRALRSSEKHIYAKVRECFRISASDYNPSSQAVRTFYALLQDKFHHAVTGMTSSKLILDRADHLEADMGLQTIAGEMPTVAEVKIGKNYLRSDELYRLHLLCEQFLLFAEATALAGRSMTMDSLHEQLDRLLTLNNYPVFDGYQDYLRDEAITHAVHELRHYRKRRQIESNGIKYDPDALANGEYEYDFDAEEDDASRPRVIDDDDY